MKYISIVTIVTMEKNMFKILTIAIASINIITNNKMEHLRNISTSIPTVTILTGMWSYIYFSLIVK